MGDIPKIRFKYEFLEGDDHEMHLRGYRNDIIVLLPDGKSYELSFFDPSRVEQEVMEIGYLTEKNLIILKEVNMASITNIVEKLWREGFFDELKVM